MTPTRETFGNIPVSSQYLFYGLALLSCAVFVRGVWLRLRLWRPFSANQSPSSFLLQMFRQIPGGIRAGLRRVAIEGFGQQRIRGRGLPSRAHAALVAGFLVLLLGTTLLEIDHLGAMISEHLKFHRGSYYVAYEFLLDGFGLLFLAGTVLFFWRRLRRPSSVGHQPTDWSVLLLFLAIGLTGYLVEGLRIGWQRPEGIGARCSPVGAWLAACLTDFPEATLRTAHLAAWWLHSFLVFGFIAAIPYTRLFHLIAAPLHLLVSRPILGQMQPVTLDQMEKDERVGIYSLDHLSWQQRLSLDACMECGRCEEACPAFATAKPLSPKRVIQSLKRVMEEQGAATPPASTGDSSSSATSKTNPKSSAGSNLHQVIEAETLWSCTACSACASVCPVRIDPVTLLLDLRRHLLSEGGLSGTAATALRRLQSSGNPWGLPQADRSQWRDTGLT